ncbi:conserved hypothetical protein [Candidatus Sulfopaludibacter sp. SbA4]|nr:conserved hypothetical protein [Candidatus Sulfopaludibacter sp. SbA4]
MSSTIFHRPLSDGTLMHPEAGGDQRAIREQLERILESPGFRNSKRYPNLLRHVVERALQGQTSDLKERTLGIEVFGRSPDYDPATDPVVRVSAGEIRKRIAQYYHESGHEAEIRIDLPIGSYLPEFRFSKSNEHLDLLTGPPVPNEVPREPAVIPLMPKRLGLRRHSVPRLLDLPLSLPLGLPTFGILAVGLVMVALAWFRPWVRPSNVLDQFWAPVLNPSAPVVLCVARGPLPPGALATPEQLISRPSGIAWHDVATLARLTGLIQSKGQPFQLRREELASFGELQEGPVVLVGAFNDAWTLRLMEGMRFGFHQDGTAYWIADQQDPGKSDWKIDLGRKDAQGRPSIAQDYALISRFLNPRTGKIVVVVAGLYGFGTEAAGRLLTDARQMESLTGHVPPRWEKKNLQIVIGTEVIDRSPGPAHVLAAYSW